MIEGRWVLNRLGGRLAGIRRKPETLSKMPISVRAAKRGLPPIPAFGIGWLYPVCPRRANLAIPRTFFIPPDEVLPRNATDMNFLRSLQEIRWSR